MEPFLPDAFLDYDSGKIGYEVNFNRYFYKYQEKRKTDEIIDEIKVVQNKLKSESLNISFDELKKITYPKWSEENEIFQDNFIDEFEQNKKNQIKRNLKLKELHTELILNYFYYIGSDDQLDYRPNQWFQSIPRKWKTKKLFELFEIRSEKGGIDELPLSVTQDKGVIPSSDLGDSVVQSESTEGHKLIYPGDFVISLRTADGGIECCHQRGVVSPGYTVIKPKLPYDVAFYSLLFKSHNFIVELNKYVKGIRDGKTISFNDLKHTELPYFEAWMNHE